MKKLIILLLTAALIITFASCGNAKNNPETSETESSAVTTEEVTVTEEAATEAETEEDGERYVYEGISLILPEGFSTDTSQGITLATYKDYPNHSDNISFVLASEQDAYESYTEEALYQSFTHVLENIDNFKFEKSENADFKLVTADFDVTYNGVSMHEKSCTFFFGKTVTITFTSVSGEFDAAFEQTLQSVQIVK